MSHAANEYVKHLRVSPSGKQITPAEKSVLSQLADDHNQDKGVAWPSVGNLAARACMTDRHCRRLLRELEAKGVIETNPRLREQNGGRSSSEYRFCQIDPPFDAKTAAVTAKKMRLQLQVNAARPKQESLYAPPDTDVRGARTPMSAGGGQREPRGADTDVRGARTPMSGQEPLKDPLTLTGVDLPTDPEKQTPLPPKGGVKFLSDSERWQSFSLDLKSELLSIAPIIAKAKGFTVVTPSEGADPIRDDNDFHVCFRDWWLREARRLPNGLILITEAADYGATQRGIEKYRGRLERLAQKRFLEGVKKTVTFKLLGAPALPPVKTEPLPQTKWDELRDAIETSLGLLPARERNEAMQYFHSAIADVRLLRVNGFTNPQVWTLGCVNPKKTAAVMAMYRKNVIAAAEKVNRRRLEFEFRPLVT